ncbi:hypothetical protein RND81_12G149200 [Saponaria officinalis]|uniref:RING-type domain-containing protein n=1 Tax=Saponaria officinalis TaxID=3572 RepID=A0AAW1HAQ3_SAPOF
MGLDETDVDAENKCLSSSDVSCSICLEFVTDSGERSRAKLQCGHEFHLDCIGSAFNSKGAMQCPNCRKIEKGQWNYSTGCRSLTEFIDDLPHDEDDLYLNYSEMFGVQWCPLPGFSRPPTFEDGEFARTAYHDLFGQHTIFAEQAPISSTHRCPYVAYYGPVHSSSLSSAANLSDGPNFSNQWGGPSGPSEHQTSYPFAAMEPHFQGWEHHSMPFIATGSRLGASDQPSAPFVDQRSSQANADSLRSGSFVHPFNMNRSSGPVTSSMVPPYPGSAARARDRVQALQAYFQPPSTSPPLRHPLPMFPGTHRSNAHRSVSQMGPPPSSSDQAGSFYVFPSSGGSFHEMENPSQFRGWERGHLESFPSTASGPNGSHQRHGLERSPSQSRP